jgi:UDP-2-acetamido-3-amino-2,3-dideoxy-glucuronate N-acetyltransferase
MEKSELKIGIIGAGRWGKNHVRTANSLLQPEQIVVLDFDDKKSGIVKEINEKIIFTTDINQILNDPDISGVIIASPAETHYELTKQALMAGKNVLVEKPIALDVGEAEELVKVAENKNLKLMVGHVLLYHPAVLKIKEEIDSGRIGMLQYIYSNRLNLGAIRSEENILWSFAPHDISVIQYLVNKEPVSVKADGAVFVQKNIEDTTLTYLEYPDGVKAHIFVSWLHPFKEQRLVVIGSEGMIVFEDTLKEEKLKFYKKGFVKSEEGIEKFDSEFELIEHESKMPLTEEHIHFYDCIINDKTPRTDGNHAVEVLKILQKASEKLAVAKGDQQ